MRQPISDEERCWGGRKWVYSSEAQRVWLLRMAHRGWTVPEWPVEYGGGGLSDEQAKVLREAMDELGCRPPLDRISQAVAMLGPTILQLGTEAQKRQHLAPIARGEIRWCQGYSEPGAGSDLAAVRTHAEDAGDHFLVNGQKIWTSHAEKSDWIFMLVRTDLSAPKHLGITFLMANMDTPGIEVRPIKLISGKSAFCEVFFDNVKIPKVNMLGEINRGWDVAKSLLSHERGSIATAKNLTAGESLGVQARRLRGAEYGSLADAALRAEIGRYEVDAWAFSAASERSRDLAHAGQSNSSFASVLKIAYSELDQRRLDLLMAAGGTDLLDLQASRWNEGQDARAWLRSRGNTIEGGTTEIQLNIIAKRVLNLPGA
jgi:acyl-CoA dehydrogenase